jgi:hypothetical protein
VCVCREFAWENFLCNMYYNLLMISLYFKSSCVRIVAGTITSFVNIKDVSPPVGRRAAKWDKLSLENKVHDIVYRRCRTARQHGYETIKKLENLNHFVLTNKKRQIL